MLLATLWVIGAAVSGWVERSLKRQFDVTGNVFRGLMAERAERLLGETSLLAGDFALKRAIATYDPDTLSSVARQLPRAHRRRPALDHRRERPPARRLGASATAAAHARRRWRRWRRRWTPTRRRSAVTEVDGGLVQLVAVPVFGPDPIGYLLAGEAIDDATARQLEANTGPAVSFLTALARLRLVVAGRPSATQLFPDGAVERAGAARAARARAGARAGRSARRSSLQLRRRPAALDPHPDRRAARPSRSSRWCRTRTTAPSGRSPRCRAGWR